MPLRMLLGRRMRRKSAVMNQGIGLRWTDTKPPCYKGNKHRMHPLGFPTGLGPDGPQETHTEGFGASMRDAVPRGRHRQRRRLERGFI